MALRPTHVRPLKLPVAPPRYDKGDQDRTRRLIEQAFNEFGLNIQILSDAVGDTEGRLDDLEGGNLTPPVPGFTFWFDPQQEATGALPTWTNRAPDAPPVSDLVLASGDAAVTDGIINGHPAVTTTGEGDYQNSDVYIATGLFPTDDYTLFAVVQLAAIDWSGASGMIVPLRPLNNGSAGNLGWNTEPDGDFQEVTVLAGGFFVFSLVVTGGTGTLYANGSLAGSEVTPWFDEAYWDVRINFGIDSGEILLYPTALSAGDRMATEEYLAAKWG